MYVLKKLIKLRQVRMMIRECNHLTRQKYTYRIRKDLVSEKDKPYNKTIQKVSNFDDVVKENIKQRNLNWPESKFLMIHTEY